MRRVSLVIFISGILLFSSAFSFSEVETEEDEEVCDSSIDCPAKSYCDKETSVCKKVPECSVGFGRVNGSKYGDCVRCSTHDQCGWDKINNFCWPDKLCKDKPAFFAYTTSFDHPDNIKNNFTDGDRGCLTVGLNLNEKLSKYFTVNVKLIRECAIRNNIDPKWYGKHTLHGPRSPYGIEPYNPDKHKKTGCRTQDPRIHTALIYSKDRDKPLTNIPSDMLQDKFVISMRNHDKGAGAFPVDEPMVVHYGKTKGDKNNDRESHRYGTKMVYEGDKDMATVCWEERAISPQDIPVYMEAVILVRASNVDPVVSDFIQKEDSEQMYSKEEYQIAFTKYMKFLSSYGLFEFPDVWKEEDVFPTSLIQSKSDIFYLEGLDGSFSVKEEMPSSTILVPASEFTQTWVDCWTDTTWNGVVASCESPKISYSVHVWVLIASSIAMLGGLAFLFIYLLYHRET